MTKLKKSVLALAMVAGTTLSGCGKKYDVVFWSSFGADYTKYLNPIVKAIADETGYKIDHTSKKSYDKCLDAMVSATATGKYPSVAIGYPDHFAQYHGTKILVPLDDYVDEAMLNQYFPQYMDENYIYDTDGTKHLYGLPFNKSTELLGYNRVFVQYCDWLHPGKDLLNVPQTWEEWHNYEDPESKVSLYMKEFNDLINVHKKLYCAQDDKGDASDFGHEPGEGRKLVLDYSEISINTTRLMTWDSSDNAFITLVRQWDSQYTELPADQHSVAPKSRQGKVLFANQTNLKKTISMLKYFNQMHKQRIFGTPQDFGGTNLFSSDAFKAGQVMFVICSSGGLAHNTGTWQCRFSSTTIPFKDVDHKYVISQGADICLAKAKKTDVKKSFEFIKMLTTGKYQTKWCIDTGYYPASKESENSDEYKAFLNGTSYDDELAVYKREGAITNHEHYSKESENWKRFVDDAFIGSAKVRSVIKAVLPNVFGRIGAEDLDNTEAYYNELKDILTQSSIKSNRNVVVDLAPLSEAE